MYGQRLQRASIEICADCRSTRLDEPSAIGLQEPKIGEGSDCFPVGDVGVKDTS